MTDFRRPPPEGCSEETEVFDDQLTRVDGKPQPPHTRLDALSVPRLFVGKQENPQTRYELNEVLGEGQSGQVYAAWDRDLNREIALKVIRDASSEERDRFLREARVSASLGHPNIPPLYDAGETHGGTLYLSMWRVPGRSLGDLIRKAVKEKSPEALPLGTAIEVMLKLCDAVAYVHSRGIIHQDIKPDNVILGDYGEVMLLDWGAAAITESELNRSNRVIGTPAYMAPERLQGDMPNPSFDIYAIGATLFHLVLLRKPLMEGSESRFWQRKRGGEIDAPSVEELIAVPRPLIGIALKAMSTEPRDRYSTVSDLAQALRDFQAGRNVWSAPVVVETFCDDGYLDRWASVLPDHFHRDAGHLVSRCELGGILLYKQRLAAGIAIEFEGEILNGFAPGDLSVIWTDDNLVEPGNPHWPKPGSVWGLQVGAFSNLMAGIYRGMVECVAGRPLSLGVGVRYRVRAEINERNLRLLLNGELVAEYQDLFPIPSGYVGLYSYYPGKAFYNVKLYERGFPERISPTAIGDAFFSCNDYSHAAEHYARVSQLLPSSGLADEATYKRGLALLSLGDAPLAERVWSGLRDDAWRARATLHRTDAAFDEAAHEEVVQSLRETLRAVPDLATTVINRWVKYVTELCTSDISQLPMYLELREAEFPNHAESLSAVAASKVALGHWSEVVARFSEQHIQYVTACNCLGDFRQVAERYSAITWISDFARLRIDCRSTDISPQFRNIARLLAGDISGALEAGAWHEALLAAGRYEEVLTLDFVDPEDRAAALRGLGRLEEAVSLRDARALAEANAGADAYSTSLRLAEQLYVLHHLAFQALFGGDLLGYRHYCSRAATLPCAAIWEDVWQHRFVLIPLVNELTGIDNPLIATLREALRAHGHKWYGKLSYLARFMLGECDEAVFAGQPCQLYIKSRTILANALRAELLRDGARARAAYARYLELAPLERRADSARGDPIMDQWAKFRCERVSFAF